MSASKVQFTFEIQNPDGSERKIELAQDMVKIGKHPSSHILLESDGVSRMHAYVEASAIGEVVIMDLGSASGTFVNGEKVTKKRTLMSGDRITVGETTITAWLDGATGASAGTATHKAVVKTAPRTPALPVAATVAAAPVANPFATPVAASAFAPMASPVAVKPTRAADPFTARPRTAAVDPFGTPLAPESTSSDDSVDGYYAIVPSGPAVAVGEVDSNVPAIEVMVLWGERDILHVSHLSPLRPFVVGEGPAKTSKDAVAPDFRMEASFLGAEQMPIAIPEGNGVAVIVPAGATISVRQGAELRADAKLRDGGELRASSALQGAMQYQLREGETARVTLKGFVFQVKAVNAGLPLGLAMRPDPRPFYYVGSVGAFAAALFLTVNFLLPPPAMLGGDQLDLDNRYVQAMIEARENPPIETPHSTDAGDTNAGQASAGDSGAAGARDQPQRNNRMAVRGDASPDQAVIGQTSGAEAVRNNVVVNAVATIAAMFSSGPTSEFGAETAIGSDAMDALGNLIGANVGISGGVGGLGPQGSGLGGGGDGRGTAGIGNGPHTIGGGLIGGRGDGTLGDRVGQVPRVRIPPTAAVTGGLTSDQIRRVIQRNVSQVQHCYEQGLQRNPSLAGRVSVSFMISPTGAVGASNVSDNSLGDTQVGSCIAGAVRRWSFPQPDPAGVVSVRFPFNLSQSGQ